MELVFTEEQKMMQKMVRDFAEKEIAPIVEEMEETDRFPREVIKRMGELGLMGIPIPEAYGGAEMDYTSYIIAIHELSKVSATVGVILSVHT
ncbi:acyl-CoA dehydrogenase family protein, partial [Planococcus sp. SIMBA_143]